MTDSALKIIDEQSLEWKAIRGLTGDSEYEIAVKNGFIGTEEEWITTIKPDNHWENIKNKPSGLLFEDLAAKIEISENANLSTFIVQFEDFNSEYTTIPLDSESYSDISTNSSLKKLIGNIKAFLKKVLTTSDIKNNLTTKVYGEYILDATQGKVLNTKLTSLTTNLTTDINKFKNYPGFL